MEEKNELNDIILNRGNSSTGMKKVMLAVASLAILLIIVVVIMSSLNSGGTANLPKPTEPPKPSVNASSIEEDPLFEPVAIEEAPTEAESLDSVAKKIKRQSQEAKKSELISGPEDITDDEEATEVVVPAKYEKPLKKVAKKLATKKTVSKKAVTKSGNYYIQVGSFTRFSPDKKFLKKIKNGGYHYTIQKVEVNGKKLTKVLVGPYSSDKAARKDIGGVRAKIEPHAFLTRI